MAIDVWGPAGLTLEAWAEMDEDEPGELVEGRLVEEEVPSLLHEAVVAWLIRVLDVWASTRGAWVFGSEIKLGIRNLRRGRKPDVVMYLPGSRVPARGSSMVTRPPDVVIEVLSPLPRDVRGDRVEKMDEYARFGVPFYWILDPQNRMLEIYERTNDGSYMRRFAAVQGMNEVPGCEGLSMDLDVLWTRLDALPPDDEEAWDEGEGAPEV